MGRRQCCHEMVANLTKNLLLSGRRRNARVCLTRGRPIHPQIIVAGISEFVFGVRFPASGAESAHREIRCRKPAALNSHSSTTGYLCCGRSPPVLWPWSPPVLWPVSDRATTFDRHGLTLRRNAFLVESGCDSFGQDGALSGEPRTTKTGSPRRNVQLTASAGIPVRKARSPPGTCPRSQRLLTTIEPRHDATRLSREYASCGPAEIDSLAPPGRARRRPTSELAAFGVAFI